MRLYWLHRSMDPWIEYGSIGRSWGNGRPSMRPPIRPSTYPCIHKCRHIPRQVTPTSTLDSHKKSSQRATHREVRKEDNDNFLTPNFVFMDRQKFQTKLMVTCRLEIPGSSGCCDDIETIIMVTINLPIQKRSNAQANSQCSDRSPKEAT